MCHYNIILQIAFSPPKGQIKIQDRELRRFSPVALKNWSSIFPHLRSLRRLSLRGNYLRHNLEELLRKVPFSLLSLNLEDCGLSAKDFRFLAGSQHRNTLTELNIGDLDMGDDKFGHILHLIKSVPRVRKDLIFVGSRLLMLVLAREPGHVLGGLRALRRQRLHQRVPGP